MNQNNMPPPRDSNAEIASIIGTLLHAEQRLEELTKGEVDAVADGQGRTFLLRRAQEQLRDSQAAKQAAILDALPAHIALLDSRGVIIALNEGWRRFARDNKVQGLTDHIGVNYLDVCDRVLGACSKEACLASNGIKLVMSGREKSFCMEYSCHSPSEQRWFMMTVSPLSEGNGVVVMHQNITDRKQCGEAIDRAMQRLEEVQHIGQIGDWEFDIASQTITWSRQVFEILQRDSKLGPPRDLLEHEKIYDVESRALIKERVDEAVKTGNSQEYELVATLPDGEKIYVHVRMVCKKDKHGRVSQLAGTIQNISERKRAEVAHQRQQTELKVLFDLMPAMIWFKDTSNRILRANQSAAKAAGKSIEDLEGRSIQEIYPQQAAGYYADDLEVVKSGMPKLGIVETIQGSAGQTFWIQTDKVPVCDQQGKVTGIVVMAQDITKRRNADEALRESEERFSNAFEYAPIGVALVSITGRWLKVNQALCNLFGYSSEELLARTFQDLTHPDDLGIDLDNARLMLSGESQSYKVEKRYIHAQGHIVHVLLNVSLVRDEQGAPRYFISQIQDITERKNAAEHLLKNEIQLRQSQKMDAIGRLAGGVAHDFNNLLTVILGRAELLQSRSDLSKNDLRNIKLIHETGLRAAGLTRQLLQFSRQQVQQPQILDINVLIPDMLDMLRRLISEDINLVLKLESGARKIKADPSQIQQVIMNLVINARDAMPSGGTLKIETTIVDVSKEFFVEQGGAFIPGPHVMLSVGDTGCGMDDKTRARIFEPFFTTKEMGKGTGLGLSTVYGIVKQAGGSIYVYSELNHGTVFKVYFPEIIESPSATISNATLLPVIGGGETILLVEDEGAIRELLNEILTSKGYSVLVTMDGEDAIRCSNSYKGEIHLLLTDVVMPKMNGKEVAKRLTESRPGMKVVFMSGYTSDAIVSRGVLEEGLEFLEKPFSPTSVAKRLRQVLDGKVDIA